MKLKKIKKKIIKKLKAFNQRLIAERTMDHLKNIRTYELERVTSLLPDDGNLLEIGAGTGWQAQALEKLGYNVSAIDIESSNYSDDQIWPVKNYDGNIIPFDDDSFDIIFSSNVLEHIPHVFEFQAEIHRVLKPNGIVLHVLPSSSWRVWTSITHLIRYYQVDIPHGEHSKNCFEEIFHFNHRWWRRLFVNSKWVVQQKTSNNLFYTGNSIMDQHLSINTRRLLSYLLGASCTIFVLKQ